MDLTVIIPTSRRPAKAAACVAALAAQDYPGSFEVLVGVDGPEDPPGTTPQTVDAAWDECRNEQSNTSVIVEQFDKQGQASVRNHLLNRVQGQTLVFLNDDMIPEPGFLTAHAEAQRACSEAGEPALIVGDSPWRLHEPDRLFDRLIRETSMVFFYDQMRALAHQPDHDWGFRHAWLLNLSAPAALVRSVGGFTVFPSTYGYEDDELAFRLRERFATRVLYRPDAVATHDHRIEPSEYLTREYRLGYAAWGFAKTTPACAQEMFSRDITSDDEIAYASAFVERERTLAQRLEQTFLALADISADALPPASPLINVIYEQHVLLKRWHWRRGLLDASTDAAGSEG